MTLQDETLRDGIQSPSVVDPNSFTPEYKTFLVKLERLG